MMNISEEKHLNRYVTFFSRGENGMGRKDSLTKEIDELPFSEEFVNSLSRIFFDQ
jgi:hypothetical protein